MADKKSLIISYILDKINRGEENFTQSVADNFEISRDTVYNYINELIENGTVKRVKRGCFELTNHKIRYTLLKEKGEFDSDMYAFNHCLKNEISDLPANVRSIWSYVFTEMTNNVIDHSMSDRMYVEIQRDEVKTTVKLHDYGVGIFNKISDFFNLDSTDDALCELYKGKLTTDNVNHSGEGIFFSSKMMDEFFIISGGKVFSTNIYDDTVIKNSGVVENDAGTLIIMSLSNTSNKTSAEIFNTYSSTDGGFTKTKIPLKNMFDMAPVSRSQAKRVCNNLEKFREVIFEFSGVEWMGQGFAHQIFVVFHNANPDIKLTVVNMNSDVESMYNHVVTG